MIFLHRYICSLSTRRFLRNFWDITATWELRTTAASVTTRDNKWSAQAGLLFLFYSSNFKSLRVIQPLNFLFFCGSIENSTGCWGLRDRNGISVRVTWLKLFCICRNWRLKQPEPYFHHGVNVTQAAEVLEKCSACFHTRGIALPPQSIPTLTKKGQYLLLF